MSLTLCTDVLPIFSTTEQIFIISTCIELRYVSIYNVQCIVHFNFYYLFTRLLGTIKTFFQLNKVCGTGFEIKSYLVTHD